MIPDVHILVTCRNPELKAMSLLVFDTIRIGFPTARIRCYLNDTNDPEIVSRCHAFSDDVTPVDMIHHKWIQMLLNSETEPFVICDTDMVFYSKVEDWKFDTALAGYRIPEFDDEFTNTITRSRLHTSLMFIDPEKFNQYAEGYESAFPETPFNPIASYVDPLCIPLNGRGYFHDTMSMAYHAFGGTEFTQKQKSAYFHFHYGTLSDLVLPLLGNGEGTKGVRDAILANPAIGLDMWRVQDEYLNSRRPNLDGVDVIAKIEPQDSVTARAWNIELCRGDSDAMKFCDLWYGYVHGIDDLVDTVNDGRPAMSKRQMIGLFFHAALLYNSAFYKANQSLLFPLILDITSTYTTSVEWENSPVKHRRELADHMRMAGSRMYGMVALIVGGGDHAQEMSQRIHEQDWTRQHDEAGQPI
jgi:hypothetical protein